MMTDLYTDAPSLSLALYRHKPKMKHCEYYTRVMETLCCDQISHSSQKYESAHVRLRARASRLTYFPGLYI